MSDRIRKALDRAFILGQAYWADADSESYAANKRSDGTLARFHAFRDAEVAALDEGAGDWPAQAEMRRMVLAWAKDAGDEPVPISAGVLRTIAHYLVQRAEPTENG